MGNEELLIKTVHELSVISDALQFAIETANSAGARRVNGARLRVGVLSGASPDALRFAWPVACRDTIADGAWLEIETVQAACWCARCQGEFVCDDFFNECPRCHELSGDLRRGRELELAAVEMS
jgi:hydrogenase nickel incorporation protein HypA/HybF